MIVWADVPLRIQLENNIQCSPFGKSPEYFRGQLE